MGVEEPRRSGRATKGQHTKNVDLPPNTAKTSKKQSAKRSKNASTEATPEEEDDSEAIIRCICGTSEEDSDDERMMICCDRCSSWQHNECMEVPEDEDSLPEQYLCEKCNPEGHKGLLEKIAKGEKPWEERALEKEREELEKNERKGKRGKKGKPVKKGRPSDVKSEAGEDDENKEGMHSDEPAQDKSELTKTNGSKAEGTPLTLDAKSSPLVTRENPVKRKSRGEATDHIKVEIEKEPKAKMRKISTTEPGHSAEKRRQSSAQAMSPAGQESKGAPVQTQLTLTIDELQNPIRKATANAFLRPLVDLVKKSEAAGSFKIPSGQTAQSVATQLTLRIEHALCLNHSNQPGDPNQIYRSRARTMVFNLKQNPALCDRLLDGSLAPDEFSTMSTDDMASKELQQRTAEMKKVAEKQNFLTQEEGPRIRRTHKGDELIDDDRDFGAANESIFSSAPARRRESMAGSETPQASSPDAMSPNTGSHAEITTPVSPSHKPLGVNTQVQTQSGGTKRKSSEAFNIQDVWSSVHSPGVEKQRPSQIPRNSQDFVSRSESQNEVNDPEIDHLLKDDNTESPPYSPTDYGSDPSVVWKGKVNMPGVADFFASAKHVAGADLFTARNISWDALMPDALSIEGRIQIERASEYLCGLQFSKTTDVTVVALTPTGGYSSQIEFEKLWQYFHDRKRYGVVGKLPVALVKDAYVIPVEDGTAKLPLFMDMLEYMTLEDARPERTILVAYVVKYLNVATTSNVVGTSGSPLTAANATFAPTPTPMGHPGSAISPVHAQGIPSNSPEFASSQRPFAGSPADVPPATTLGYGPPMSKTETLASQILGPLADTVVVKQLLEQGSELGTVQFEVIKGILEQTPAARNDLNLLSILLVEKSRAAGH
ncbi:MAG: hypothetical protein M4579_002463 [Chaenotheca gracillima]|nr:MAG: hypothetical protein M4579_002463 [Chaenotheca gracillima]